MGGGDRREVLERLREARQRETGLRRADAGADRLGIVLEDGREAAECLVRGRGRLADEMAQDDDGALPLARVA